MTVYEFLQDLSVNCPPQSQLKLVDPETDQEFEILGVQYHPAANGNPAWSAINIDSTPAS